MRTILLSACLAAGMTGFFAPPARAAEGVAPELESLAWLLGRWNRTGLPEGQEGYEHWRIEGKGYAGIGARLRNGQVAFEERLWIKADGGEVFYVAEVHGNPAPVRFRLVERAERSAVFENPEHDFPKRISYRLTGDHLEARISGDGREITFGFERESAP